MATISQRTVVIAASILSVLAALQLVVVFTVLTRQSPLPSVSLPTQSQLSIPEAPVASTSTSPAQVIPDVPLPPFPLPSESVPPPRVVESDPIPISEIDIVLQRALAARDKGDMGGTLAGLRDAQKIYPDHPKILAEFATTYESMGLIDKALVFWKRVVDAGEAAGELYGVAAEKVRLGIIPRDPPGGRDEQGLQIGSIMGLGEVVKNYNLLPNETERISLRVPIKARQGSLVDAGRVNIQVNFFDLVNNTDVEVTDAQVTSEWATPPADWLDEGIEVLRVLYTQNSGAVGGKSALERRFLGYIIRVYYENELQDVFADPVKLLQSYPPPFTLQQEIPQ